MRKFMLSIGFIVLIGQLAYSQNPFRTKQSGNWNDPNIREEYADCEFSQIHIFANFSS
jgi:hypothetical protein